MKGRRSPIDRMRELADDGLEPWQIAAALGVREEAVLVALNAVQPAGGAQRAVEDACSLVPVTEHIEARLAEVLASVPEETWGADATQAPMSEPSDATTAWEHPTKPDTLAPTRPMTRVLAEHVAGYADGMAVRACEVCAAPVDDDGTDEPWCIPCRAVLGAVAGGMPPDLAFRAHRTSLDNPAVEAYLEATAAAVVVEASEPEPEPATPHGSPSYSVDGIPFVMRALDPVEFRRADPALTEILNDPEHVHDPFPVADEAGVWHAECECGHRWDRAPCEYSGCTAYVAALHIARTGTSRHAHHPPA